MPPVKLADTRTQTLESARQCIEQIAHAECRIASKCARYEKAIAAAKSRFEEETAGEQDLIAVRSAQLTQFILSHPEQFAKPRAIKTEFGSFGLRNVSNVEITDHEALTQFARDNGYTDLVKVTETLIKPAIRARLEAGELIIGASIASGEEAFYKINKALLESANAIAGESA